MARNGTRRAPVPGGATLHTTILGTADAFSSGGRIQAGVLIEAAGKRYLLEAGPAVLGGLKRAGIAADTLDAVIISHLHGDHFGGLPFLMLEYMWERPLKRQLVIAGPPHLERRTWILLHTMFPHFKMEHIRRRIKWITLVPNKSVRFAGARVSAIRSPHTNPDVSLSVKVAAAGKQVVFSGDSGWNEEFVTFSDGADLLICECTYFESSHLRFHMNYPELRAHRDRFNVGRMVLTHLGREVLHHATEVDIEMAFDGMKLEV